MQKIIEAKFKGLNEKFTEQVDNYIQDLLIKEYLPTLDVEEEFKAGKDKNLNILGISTDEKTAEELVDIQGLAYRYEVPELGDKIKEFIDSKSDEELVNLKEVFPFDTDEWNKLFHNIVGEELTRETRSAIINKHFEKLELTMNLKGVNDNVFDVEFLKTDRKFTVEIRGGDVSDYKFNYIKS